MNVRTYDVFFYLTFLHLDRPRDSRYNCESPKMLVWCQLPGWNCNNRKIKSE